MTKNDWKYVLKRVITYIAIAMIMLLLGSCNVKAVSVSPTTSSIYCAYGSQSRIVDSETNYSGCTNINRQSGYSLVTNTYGDLDTNKNYDISGSFLAPYRSFGTISVKVNGTSCFITNVIYEDTTTQSSRVTYNYFCNNVGINNNKQFATVVQFTGVSPGLQLNGLYSSDSINVEFHFDENNNTAAAINQNTEAVNNVNNTLNDNTPPSSSEVGSNTSDWASNNTDSGVINNLVLMPITLLNSVVNGLSGTCSTYTIGELWGENLTLPCIDLSNILGAVWTIIDVIMSGVFIFIFGKRCVKIFNDFTNLRSGQIDSLYGGGE